MSKTSAHILHIDFNNLGMRCLFAKDVKATTLKPDWPMWSYLTFNSMLSYIKILNTPCHVVIAVDACKTWRKDIYPRYKEHRVAKKLAMGVDFDSYFDCFYELLKDIRANTPFRVINVEKAEADDIIASLCIGLRNNHHTVISVDEDFTQLLGLGNVRLYNPLHGEFVANDAPMTWLVKKFLTGQAKDNIFNVLTGDDWGLTPETKNKRKPGFGEVAANKALTNGLPALNAWIKADKDRAANFKRNQRLISFWSIPEVLQDDVLKTFNDYKTSSTTEDKFSAMCEKYNWMQYSKKQSEIIGILNMAG